MTSNCIFKSCFAVCLPVRTVLLAVFFSKANLGLKGLKAHLYPIDHISDEFLCAGTVALEELTDLTD